MRAGSLDVRWITPQLITLCTSTSMLVPVARSAVLNDTVTSGFPWCCSAPELRIGYAITKENREWVQGIVEGSRVHTQFADLSWRGEKAKANARE